MTNSSTTPLINHSDPIFVAGHRGMAGSAICRALQRKGYAHILMTTRQELDLEDAVAVRAWLEAGLGVADVEGHGWRRVDSAPSV